MLFGKNSYRHKSLHKNLYLDLYYPPDIDPASPYPVISFGLSYAAITIENRQKIQKLKNLVE